MAYMNGQSIDLSPTLTIVEGGDSTGGLTEEQVNELIAGKEDKSNKINEFDGHDLSNTDLYPTAQAVDDLVYNAKEELSQAIDDIYPRMEKLDNKLTHINEDVVMDDDSHTYYPSAKGMVNYVNDKIGDVETTLDNIIAIQNTLIGGDVE